jgi:hypothetical protein
MKTIFTITLCAILFACSPKYQEINDNGFGGGGSKTFNKKVLTTNSKLEKVDDQLAVNDQQFSEKVNIESETMLVAKSENLRLNSRQFQNLNGKAANNIQLKKGGMDHPKVSKLLKKLAFKSKTQKKNEVDSEIVNIWFKVFLISLFAAACIIVSSVFLLVLLSSWETPLLVFIFGAYLGFASLVVGFITLILWLMSL